MRRFLLAAMKHETNTFSPLPTTLSDFGRMGGTAGPISGEQAVRAFRGRNNASAAFIDLAEQEKAEYEFAIAATAVPSGLVDDDAFEAIAAEIVAAVKRGCDALFLDLHGAMVTHALDDPEGELLRRVREVNPELPIAVALDFHTNFSQAMINNATVITGYRTYPHIDTYETGLRAGRTLIRALKGEVRPVMAWHCLPMMSHMLRQTPAQQPMKDIMDRAIAAEKTEVLNASVFGGFPLSDIPFLGMSAVVVADGNRGQAVALVQELLTMAWERRAEFIFPIEPMEQSIARAKTLKDGPIILVDHGDNAGAGGGQDTMAVLEEVLVQGFEDVAAGPICDPESVAKMVAAGVNAQVTIDLGGKTDVPAMNLKGKPLRLTGVVRRITDGRYKITGPASTGADVHLGRTVVLDIGSAEVVVSEKRIEPNDVGCFTHAGIDPTRKKYVLIKSRQHFRAGFEPIAKHIVLVAGPGVCSSDYDLFPFKKIKRPIYPLYADTPSMLDALG